METPRQPDGHGRTAIVFVRFRRWLRAVVMITGAGVLMAAPRGAQAQATSTPPTPTNVLVTTPSTASNTWTDSDGNGLGATVWCYQASPREDVPTGVASDSSDYYFVVIEAAVVPTGNWSVDTGGYADSNGPTLEVGLQVPSPDMIYSTEPSETGEASPTGTTMTFGLTANFQQQQGASVDGAMSKTTEGGMASVSWSELIPDWSAKAITSPGGTSMTWEAANNQGVGKPGAGSDTNSYSGFFGAIVQVPEGANPLTGSVTVAGNFWAGVTGGYSDHFGSIAPVPAPPGATNPVSLPFSFNGFAELKLLTTPALPGLYWYDNQKQCFPNQTSSTATTQGTGCTDPQNYNFGASFTLGEEVGAGQTPTLGAGQQTLGLDPVEVVNDDAGKPGLFLLEGLQDQPYPDTSAPLSISLANVEAGVSIALDQSHTLVAQYAQAQVGFDFDWAGGSAPVEGQLTVEDQNGNPLNAPADLNFSLSTSSQQTATVFPSTVTVPRGRRSASFVVIPTPGASDFNGQSITATYDRSLTWTNELPGSPGTTSNWTDIFVQPASVSLSAGQTAKFQESPTVNGAQWSIFQATKGAVPNGSIDPGSGLYQAPATIAAPATDLVQFAATDGSGRTGMAVVSLLPDIVWTQPITNGVNSVAFSPDGKTLAGGSEDSTVHLWNVSDGAPIPSLAGHSSRVNSVAFSPDGKILASGSDDSTVNLWNVSDSTAIPSLTTGSAVHSVAFSPDGQTLASGGGYSFNLWSTKDWSPITTSINQNGMLVLFPIAFSPDGKILASGSEDGTVNLWNVSDGALILTLAGHSSRVNSVAFSPDGQTLASGSDDHTIKLWNVSDGAQIRTLTGQTGSVNSVAFSPDGKTLASGSDASPNSTYTLKLWKVSDGTPIIKYNLLDSDVESIAFSPSGVLFAYSDYGLGSGEVVVRRTPFYTGTGSATQGGSGGSGSGGSGSSGTAAVTVPDVSGSPDGTVTVAIQANDQVRNVAGADVTVQLGSSGTTVGAANCSGANAGSFFPGTPSLSCNDTTPGRVHVVLVSTMAGNGPGTIVGFPLKIAATTPVGNYPLTLVAATLSDAKGNPVQAGLVSGTLHVVPRLCGDANGDGKVNLADAILALNMAVGLVTPTSHQVALLDFDGNMGKVDLADVIILLNFVVGLRPSLPCTGAP